MANLKNIAVGYNLEFLIKLGFTITQGLCWKNSMISLIFNQISFIFKLKQDSIVLADYHPNQ
jgi:hypothetical protein